MNNNKREELLTQNSMHVERIQTRQTYYNITCNTPYNNEYSFTVYTWKGIPYYRLYKGHCYIGGNPRRVRYNGKYIGCYSNIYSTVDKIKELSTINTKKSNHILEYTLHKPLPNIN